MWQSGGGGNTLVPSIKVELAVPHSVKTESTVRSDVGNMCIGLIRQTLRNMI